MDRRLRIAIATNGRFHVLDLARELIALGHDVTFYSILPTARAKRFGLPAHVCISVLPWLAPILAWERIAPRIAPAARERWHALILNRAITARLRPCDVFIGMSGLILEAGAAARDRFGARIFVERGSKHILAQAEILADQGAEGPSAFAISRELATYELADRIMIPADHVRHSFARDPVAAAKLLINPYGVDLDAFSQVPRPARGHATILFVGGWLLRKGVDVLVAAVRLLPDARLIHVGGRGDHPFPPDDPQFTRIGPVDQQQLERYYHQADCFAIASREEGLALVQVQALATGLAVVCTDQTGGRDLKYTPALADRITEVPVDDVAALSSALARALAAAADRAALPEPDRDLLSWRAYAERYVAHMLADIETAGSR